MAIFCIGDVHGCYNELQNLLQLCKFAPKKDELIFTGDIIGRGPEPLKVVEFIRSLKNRAHLVLGNHDLNFIAICKNLNKPKKKDMLSSLLNSPKLDEIVDWFCQQPLVYKHPLVPLYVVHAGIAPQWDLETTLEYSKEIEKLLTNKKMCNNFLMHMYSDEPNLWNDELSGFPRWRFITNVCTRIRFCYKNGSLDFMNKNTPEKAENLGLYPWFSIRGEKPISKEPNQTLVFGHWAALMGNCHEKNIKALDTGCVWGGCLTAWCYDNNTFYSVKSEHSIS
ncbi:MAG: symmetrical bis(5'-nucleosyl)-tetraphosphatase [Succinivibrionaceae bacterium]